MQGAFSHYNIPIAQIGNIAQMSNAIPNSAFSNPKQSHTACVNKSASI